MIAIVRKNSKMVRLLIDNGADVNRIDAISTTTLMLALVNNLDKEIIHLILEKSTTTLNKFDEKHEGTPLSYAAKENKTDIALLILSYGAEVDLFKDSVATPLLSAVKNDNIQLIVALLSSGATCHSTLLNGCYDEEATKALTKSASIRKAQDVLRYIEMQRQFPEELKNLGYNVVDLIVDYDDAYHQPVTDEIKFCADREIQRRVQMQEIRMRKEVQTAVARGERRAASVDRALAQAAQREAEQKAAAEEAAQESALAALLEVAAAIQASEGVTHEEAIEMAKKAMKDEADMVDQLETGMGGDDWNSGEPSAEDGWDDWNSGKAASASEWDFEQDEEGKQEEENNREEETKEVWDENAFMRETPAFVPTLSHTPLSHTPSTSSPSALLAKRVHDLDSANDLPVSKKTHTAVMQAADSNDAQRSGMEIDDMRADELVCPTCTLINPETASACMACETSLIFSMSTRASAQATAHDAAARATESSYAAAACAGATMDQEYARLSSAQGRTCFLCTFLNKKNASKCEMCETPLADLSAEEAFQVPH